MIADFEDDREHFVAGNTFRNLSTNRLERRRIDVIREGARARASFSDARWLAFKADLSLFREAMPVEAWHRSAFQADHGYNGSPITTTLLGGLAQQSVLTAYGFIQVMRWMDLVLVAAFGALAARWLGTRIAAEFLLLFWLNPLNEYGYVGGSYLRYNYALSLGLGWLLLQRGALVGAGASLALSTGLRLFPGGFVGMLGIHQLLQPSRFAAIRRTLPLYVAFAATLAVAIAGTSLLRTPDGRNAWAAFSERIGTHATGYAYNVIGLSLPFGYAHEYRYSELARRYAEEGDNVDWEMRMHEVQQARRPWRIATALVLGVGLLVAARRIGERDALFLGYPLMFIATDLSSYYWACLGLLPLGLHHRRDVQTAFAAFCGAGLVTCALRPLAGLGPDQLFQLLNIETAALLGAVAWRLVRHASEGTIAD